jgi:hypothetical protein
MSIGRLLLLDGEEELGINIIQIILSIVLMIRQDGLSATSWAYFTTFQVLNLLHLSNFTLIPQFKTTLKVSIIFAYPYILNFHKKNNCELDCPK